MVAKLISELKSVFRLQDFLSETGHMAYVIHVHV